MFAKIKETVCNADTLHLGLLYIGCHLLSIIGRAVKTGGGDAEVTCCGGMFHIYKRQQPGMFGYSVTDSGVS